MHSLADRHLGYGYVLSTKTKIAMQIHMYAFE